MAQDGDVNGAITALEEIRDTEPKNVEAAIELGNQLWGIGRDAEAVEAYTSARGKGAREAILALAEVALAQYRTADARQLLADYRGTLKKGRRVLAQDASGDLEARISQIENALMRVQQIEVIDSLVVDADDFFTYYRLSPESGTIRATEGTLPTDFEAAEPTTVYVTENGQTMLWGAADSTSTVSLQRTAQLYGGQWEQPHALGANLGGGGDANYPFLMPDGITLYYASDGEGSLGGLDIFISRSNDEGEFLQPQNMGMPYNSPYNDYLLAIDELTGAGWWASDRNRIPGKVTIYVFVPQELRKNVSPEAADLRERASLSSIRSTWEEGKDYNALRRAIASIRPGRENAPSGPVFQFAMPNGKVYTRLEQFSTPRSRYMMRQYLAQKGALEKAEAALAQARLTLGKGQGSESLRQEIAQAEQALPLMRRELRDLANEIISLE